MNSLKLKVCGMRDPGNIREVAELKPDYLGLIFFEKSPRHVNEVIPETNASIKKTGVFVDASADYILKRQQEYKLSAIQLHGNESPQFCRELKNSLPKNVELIKVFSVGEDFDFSELEPYEGVVDFFLFDTKGKNKGGNGISFDWEILKKYPSTVPFFLSGGIGPEGVSEIKELHQFFEQQNKQGIFYGVDVNSRFETEPALKDAKKLKIFRESLLS
ncbi:phosphoribosylanthranilate isomerase [Salinimicrobium soli]|uniref:phosphoribosylanthranilate isomerase n=1 Tax=Salinimicrobium soli TaxID=1254399 RepID=UPI003AAC4527